MPEDSVGEQQRKPRSKAYRCAHRDCENSRNTILCVTAQSPRAEMLTQQLLNGHTPQLLLPAPTKPWNKLMPIDGLNDGWIRMISRD